MIDINKNLELQNDLKYANISLEDVQALYNMLERKKVLEKYKFPDKPSSDGYYHIYVADESKKSGRRQIKAKTIEQLEDKVYEHESSIITPDRQYTFHEVFTIVEDRKLEYVKDKEKLISKKNTAHINQFKYRRYYQGVVISDKFIKDITKEDIEDTFLMNLKRYDMRKKAYTTMCTIAKQVFDYAFENYLIIDNPYLRVNHKKFKEMILPDAPIEERAYSDEEVQMILDEIHRRQGEASRTMSLYALEMQILCGMRIGEVTCLMWSDVSDSDGIISINKQNILLHTSNTYKYQIVNHTKTYKDRLFPITTEVNEFLVRLRLAHSLYYPETLFLFPSRKDKGIPVKGRAVYCMYESIVNDLGIKKQSRTGPHSFRRNAITKVANMPGGGLELASRLYGNSPFIANKNYYTGLNMDYIKNMLDSQPIAQKPD